MKFKEFIDNEKEIKDREWTRKAYKIIKDNSR